LKKRLYSRRWQTSVVRVELAQQEVRGQAVRAGAFGGSRQAVAEQELQRNILEQQARTAAQLRAAGFESVANRALQAAQATGQLGQIGAGAAAGAAEAGGRLGLSAEQLAQAERTAGWTGSAGCAAGNWVCRAHNWA
jgi:protein involved in temperature-dependent protein secretion